MKNLTDKQIEEGIDALIKPLQKEESYDFYDMEVNCIRNDKDHVLVEIISEYESPCRCSDALLDQIKTFLGASNIEKYDDISRGGCETCDYGSSYGFAVRAWN